VTATLARISSVSNYHPFHHSATISVQRWTHCAMCTPPPPYPTPPFDRYREIQIFWTLQLPKTAHSCIRHGSASPWLTSERPGNVISSPKTFTLNAVHGISVALGPIIKPMEESTKRGRLHAKLQIPPVFKYTITVVRVTR